MILPSWLAMATLPMCTVPMGERIGIKFYCGYGYVASHVSALNTKYFIYSSGNLPCVQILMDILPRQVHIMVCECIILTMGVGVGMKFYLLNNSSRAGIHSTCTLATSCRPYS